MTDLLTAPRKKIRGNGDGTIYPRRGKYAAALTVAVVDGKAVRRTREGFDTKTAAKQALKEMKADLALGVTGARDATVNTALDEWLNVTLVDRRTNGHPLRPSTIRNYSDVVRVHVRPILGTKRLDDLTPRHVEELLRVMVGKGLAGSTVRRARSALVQALDKPVQYGDIPRNVAELVKMPGTHAPTQRKSLTIEEAQGFVSMLGATQGDEAWNGYRYAMAWILQLQTGLRPGEARALRWQDIDWPTKDVPGRLHVKHSMSSDGVLGPTKTPKSTRSIDLPVPTCAALAAHRDRQAVEREWAGDMWEEHDLIFPTEIGTACSDRYFRRSFQRATRAAGIDGKWTPHELRHSCISILSDAGEPLEKIADLVGHADTRMMSTYRHQIRPSVDTAMVVMGALFTED